MELSGAAAVEIGGVGAGGARHQDRHLRQLRQAAARRLLRGLRPAGAHPSPLGPSAAARLPRRHRQFRQPHPAEQRARCCSSPGELPAAFREGRTQALCPRRSGSISSCRSIFFVILSRHRHRDSAARSHRNTDQDDLGREGQRRSCPIRLTTRRRPGHQNAAKTDSAAARTRRASQADTSLIRRNSYFFARIGAVHNTIAPASAKRVELLASMKGRTTESEIMRRTGGNARCSHRHRSPRGRSRGAERLR